MAETAHEDTGADPSGSADRASFEELVAEPERVADAADAGPVRIDRPGRAELVLLSAAEFDRLNGRPRALYAHELSDRDLHLLRTQPIPDEGLAFEREGDLVRHG